MKGTLFLDEYENRQNENQSVQGLGVIDLHYETFTSTVAYIFKSQRVKVDVVYTCKSANKSICLFIVT
jgi:hypothetical protein